MKPMTRFKKSYLIDGTRCITHRYDGLTNGAVSRALDAVALRLAQLRVDHGTTPELLYLELEPKNDDYMGPHVEVRLWYPDNTRVPAWLPEEEEDDHILCRVPGSEILAGYPVEY